MNITDGNITYGNLHVPFFWRVSNRTELNNILIDVRGEGVEGGGREERGRGGREEGREKEEWKRFFTILCFRSFFRR